MDSSKLKSSIQNIVKNKYFLYTLAGIGALRISSNFLSTVVSYYQHALQPHKNFNEIYNEGDSWVLITEGGSNIGKAFAEQFAQKKFNVVLIYEDISTLQKFAQELMQKYHIKTKVLKADFNFYTYGFYENILNQVKDLDVAILINNVNYSVQKWFTDLTVQDSYSMLSQNALSTTFLTHLFIPRFQSRQKRSAIINVSSGLDQVAGIGSSVYGGTKAYISQFSRILAIEMKYLGDKIDVLCYSPNYLQVGEKKHINVQKGVYCGLRALGRRVYTKGHWSHALQRYCAENHPCFTSLMLSTWQKKKKEALNNKS